MSNLVEHAKVELDKAGLFDETNDFYGYDIIFRQSCE